MFKWLINVIILCSTYRTAARIDKAAEEKDIYQILHYGFMFAAIAVLCLIEINMNM